MLLIGIVFAVCFSTTMSYAQQVFGSIFGTITDPAGAVVANAKVTITDVNKGTRFEVTTDSSGTYTKGQLIPDTLHSHRPGARILKESFPTSSRFTSTSDGSLRCGDARRRSDNTKSK